MPHLVVGSFRISNRVEGVRDIECVSIRVFLIGVDRNIYEIVEMLYQNESDYIFDSARFTNAFGNTATSYADGVRETAEFYKSLRDRKE